MTRAAAPEGYMHADAAAELLEVTISRVYQLSRSEKWGRKRQERSGNSGSAPWIYVSEDVRATERTRRRR